MQSAVHAHGPQKAAKRRVHVRPESATKTDVVSRGALVKIRAVESAVQRLTTVWAVFYSRLVTAASF